MRIIVIIVCLCALGCKSYKDGDRAKVIHEAWMLREELALHEEIPSEKEELEKIINKCKIDSESKWVISDKNGIIFQTKNKYYNPKTNKKSTYGINIDGTLNMSVDDE